MWFAEKGSPWLIVNWNQELEVLSGIKLNILELLRKERMEINREQDL